MSGRLVIVYELQKLMQGKPLMSVECTGTRFFLRNSCSPMISIWLMCHT